MKKGIELSVNFLVVFIIALMILFFGIKLVSDIIETGDELSEALSNKVLDELEILASRGQRISIAFSSETINPGKQHTFGLGVVNMDAAKPFFAVKVEKGNAYDKDKNIIDDSENKLDFLYSEYSHHIALDERENTPIIIKAPAGTKPGTYIVDVYVCHAQTQIKSDDCGENSDFHYDKDNPVRKIYVEVP